MSHFFRTVIPRRPHPVVSWVRGRVVATRKGGIVFSSALVLVVLGASPGGSVYVPENLYLVRARTVKVFQKEQDYRLPSGGESPSQQKLGLPASGVAKSRTPWARFRVTHVYCGQQVLKGKCFTCEVPPFTTSGPMAAFENDLTVSSFTPDAEGPWWISSVPNAGYRAEIQGQILDQQGLRPFPYENTRAPEPFHRGRQGGAATFQEGVAWAEAVEKVATAASDEERARLLRG
jgi:hypothetical protein